MTGEPPPLDADEAATEKTSDPLYEELVRLRVLGLREKITTELSLPELTQIADAVCPDSDVDVERLKCVLKKAAKRFGGKYGMGLEALWGVDATYGWQYEDRRKKAMPLLGGKQTQGAYEKSHRERTARDFALQLRALYREVSGVKEVPERSDSVLPPWVSTNRILVGVATALLLLAALYIANPFASSAGPRGKAIPLPGTVIDATTGQIVTHIANRTTHQFAQLGGGDIFRACDFSNKPCAYSKGATPLKVRVGDIVEFSILLHNPDNRQVPYIRMYVSSYTGGEVALSLKWSSAFRSQFTHLTDSAKIAFPQSAPFPDLTYISGSTVLFNNRGKVIAHLPDGIMEDGIALTNVGAPASCSYCEQRYTRYVNFKVRVTNHGQP